MEVIITKKQKENENDFNDKTVYIITKDERQ